MTGIVTGPYGRRALFLPWKSAVYRHVLIGICAMFSERGLAAQKVHGRSQGELVIHNHVSRKACKFSCSHDSQLSPRGAPGPGCAQRRSARTAPQQLPERGRLMVRGRPPRRGWSVRTAAPLRLPPGPAAAGTALSPRRALWPSTGDLRLGGPTPPSRFAELGRTPATFTFGDLVWPSSVGI